MSLTSAWIGRLIMRCLLCDWFSFQRFNSCHSPEAEHPHPWLWGVNREKGGGDISVQHSESKTDSSISHAQTNWASKRVIWYMNWWVEKRLHKCLLGEEKRETGRSTCKMKTFQNYDYILSTNRCEELHWIWNILEIMHFVRQVAKAWHHPLYRTCCKGQWITSQKDAA